MTTQDKQHMNQMSSHWEYTHLAWGQAQRCIYPQYMKTNKKHVQTYVVAPYWNLQNHLRCLRKSRGVGRGGVGGD